MARLIELEKSVLNMQKAEKAKVMFLLGNCYCSLSISAAFLWGTRRLRKRSCTVLSFIKLCTVCSYVLGTLFTSWPEDKGEKEIPTFLRAIFSFILLKKLKPLPHSSRLGPTRNFWGCTGAIVWGSVKGKGETRRCSGVAALAWLPISCHWRPSDGLSYGQQEQESGAWA